MRVLYIYRNPKMGFSIGKVFRPIERAMKAKCDVDSIEMPCYGYGIKSLCKNVKYILKFLKTHHYDIVHITGTEHYLLPFLGRHKTIVTVHDLGFYTNSRKGFKQIFKYLLWIQTLPMADHVSFISNKSKEEAEMYANFSKGQVSVIYDPIGDEYVYMPKTINCTDPIILHVGTNYHKNLGKTIEAIKGLPCKLVIIGKINETYLKLLEKNNVNFENKYNLTDTEILNEYINSDIVNFPSLHEGFGMPIIEGQSIGRPVLTSNITPMKEIAGTGAVLVNPEDVEDIKKGYKKILADPYHYIREGLKNVERFRLKKIVNQYFHIYEYLNK